MKSFKQHLHESTLATVFEMKDEQFDALLDRLDDKELNELEEGIVGAIAKGVKKVGSAAVSGVKKVAKRMSTAGRADAAQAKLAKIRQKKADRERLAKAKADIAKERQPAKPAAPKPASSPKPAAPKKPVTASYNNEEVTKDNFKPHMMYDPKTGKGTMAKTFDDHVKMDKMGYVHDKPEMKEHRNIVDTITDVLSEDGHSQNPTGDGTDLSLNDVKNIDVIRQLNAHVGMIGQREYLNPKGALLQLQGKLATIGLTFDIPAMSEDSGTEKMPLTQYGGITGKSVTTPIDQLDNDNFADGLSLQIEYETLKTGCTKIYAKIV